MKLIKNLLTIQLKRLSIDTVKLDFLLQFPEQMMSFNY